MTRLVKWAQFARDWQRCKTVAEVAGLHNMTNAEASRYAGIMRKKGVDLKKHRVGVNADFDVEKINKTLGGAK